MVKPVMRLQFGSKRFTSFPKFAKAYHSNVFPQSRLSVLQASNSLAISFIYYSKCVFTHILNMKSSLYLYYQEAGLSPLN